MTGRQNAAVFPLPVSAAIRTSPPPKTNGIPSACMSVGKLKMNHVLSSREKILIHKIFIKLTSNQVHPKLLQSLGEPQILKNILPENIGVNKTFIKTYLRMQPLFDRTILSVQCTLSQIVLCILFRSLGLL